MNTVIRSYAASLHVWYQSCERTIKRAQTPQLLFASRHHPKQGINASEQPTHGSGIPPGPRFCQQRITLGPTMLSQHEWSTASSRVGPGSLRSVGANSIYNTVKFGIFFSVCFLTRSIMDFYRARGSLAIGVRIGQSQCHTNSTSAFFPIFVFFVFLFFFFSCPGENGRRSQRSRCRKRRAITLPHRQWQWRWQWDWWWQWDWQWQWDWEWQRQWESRRSSQRQGQARPGCQVGARGGREDVAHGGPDAPADVYVCAGRQRRGGKVSVRDGSSGGVLIYLLLLLLLLLFFFFFFGPSKFSFFFFFIYFFLFFILFFFFFFFFGPKKFGIFFFFFFFFFFLLF
jgi:hypothetical protein